MQLHVRTPPEMLPGTYNAVLGPYRGNEADNIRAFKEALGLSDEDAAPAHIDVGRRIMRSRFEASTRSGNSDQFRALQKLIYVSDLVFGVQKACATSSPSLAPCILNVESNACILLEPCLDLWLTGIIKPLGGHSR